MSLHRMEDPGLKYFSGTGVYKNECYITEHQLAKDKKFVLDLGMVEVLSRVVLNGKDLGVLRKRPYRFDFTTGLRTGRNYLEVQVTNLWPNRLVGEEQVPENQLFSDAGSRGFEHLAGAGFEATIGQAIKELPGWYLQGKPKPEDGRITFTTWKHYRKDDPLLESGLIGPVEVRTALIRSIGSISRIGGIGQ